MNRLDEDGAADTNREESNAFEDSATPQRQQIHPDPTQPRYMPEHVGKCQGKINKSSVMLRYIQYCQYITVLPVGISTFNPISCFLKNRSRDWPKMQENLGFSQVLKPDSSDIPREVL